MTIDDTVTPIYAGLSVSYSTIEQLIGVFVDGKPLYQIAIPFPENMTLSPSEWAFVPYGGSDPIDTIVTGFATRAEQKGAFACRIGYQPANNRLLISPSSTLSVTVTTNDYIIMQYTKSTDVAASKQNVTNRRKK